MVNIRMALLLLAFFSGLGILELNAATTTEDILKLAQEGIEEEIQLATVLKSENDFDLSTDQIIALKKAGVADRVIAAMLRKRIKSPLPNEVKEKKDNGNENEKNVSKALGALHLENVDEKPWGYRLDSGNRILWILPSKAGGSVLIKPHAGTSLKVPVGTYTVRYLGAQKGELLEVFPKGKTLMLLSRVETDAFEGLYVSVFEKGERKAGGRLVVFREPKAGGQPQARYKYIQPAKREVKQEVFDRRSEVRVEDRSTRTIIYRSPVYVQPYCQYPYYDNTWGHHPYSFSGFRYNRHHGHGGFSIGFGIRR